MGIFIRDSEEDLLLARNQPNSQRHYKNYGSTKYRCQTSGDREIQKVPLSQLFRYATTRDKWIIGIGTVAAFVHGAGFPLLATVFGSMTDTFMIQATYGFANETITTPSPLQSSPIYEYFPTTSPNSFNNTLFQTDGSTDIPIRGLTAEEFTDYMSQISWYYVFIGLGVMLSSFVQTICWEWACERQVYRLRQEFFYQVLRQEIAWFDGHQSGDVAVKLSDDLERIREGIGHKFSMAVQSIASFLAGFLMGFITSWKLTLVILALTPILAAASAFGGKMIATQATREQQKYGKAGAVAEEVLSSIRTVVAYGGERREIKRYSVALAAGLANAVNKYHLFALLVAFAFFIMHGSYSVAFWYGSKLLYDREITPGDIFTVIFSVLTGAMSFGDAIPYMSAINTAQGCGAIVFDIVDSMPEIDPYDKRGIMPDKFVGRIHFRDVSFRYPSRPTLPILTDFNLEIEPGKTIAIVGTSGGGKSTIINLILRFYDPDTGSVLIDGNDVRALNLAWLRYHIGYVSQEPVLFGTTIYENIRYGREDVTADEIMEAAKMANAHDFISALPLGYESLVGERGSKISIGQKQRIAIARALVRSPRILLLDEATSALDSKSEAVVQMALDKARKGRTTIIIAHRLSTIKDADVIYAIKDGRIAESGTHAQLMAEEGLYYRLVMTQTTVEEMDDFSAASAHESADESASQKEYSILFAAGKLQSPRRKPKKNMKRRRKLVLPDPERSQLMREVEEVNAEYPGIWKILVYNKPEWYLIAFGSVGCIITGAVMPFFAIFFSEMFGTFAKSGDELLEDSFFWAMMFVALASVTFVGFWLRTICIAAAGEYLTMRLRLHSFIGIIRQNIGWFDKETSRPSRLATRLARDAPLVKATAGHRLAVVLSSAVTSVVSVGIAFYCGWQLALAILAGFPILAIAGFVQMRAQKGGQKKDAELMEEAGQCANEAISNIRTVQSLGQERIFFERYLELLFPAYIEGHRQAVIYGTAFSFSQAMVFIIYAVAFRYGAHLVRVGAMIPLDVYRVFFEIAFCAMQVGQSASWIPDYNKAKMAAALMFNLIGLESQIDALANRGLTPPITGHIKFNDVHFRYPGRPDVSVLRGISFEVKAGHTLAVVGPSGCGKSTLVALLERFYDVVSGNLTLDGYDIRSLNLNHLRAHIGVVTQEPVMFDCSIRDNIAYGYGDGSQYVSDDLIIEAARCANIHNFITGLPCGYHTEVGEKGTQLSAGQRQRIAIARAIIRDPKILLLDEATSALDTESEKLVQEALDKARTGRTCIIIAHRLSTIQNADCIALISRGRIAEMGTHEQLRKEKNLYYKLTKEQHINH